MKNIAVTPGAINRINEKIADSGSAVLLCQSNTAAYTEFTLPNSHTFADFKYIYFFNSNANGTALYNPHIIPVSLFRNYNSNGSPVSVWVRTSASGNSYNILLKYVSETKLQVYAGDSALVSVYGLR